MNETPADILIIDDDPANLSLLSSLLTGRGHKVRAVLNGQRGLAAAIASPPDLILMDVMMPGMNGYETCTQLKAEPKTSDIPVLFLSALNDTADKVQAFASGAVDYVTKPFQIEEVLARVETQLALRSLQRQLQSANAELRANLREVETRNSELAAFAHMVAHDLKNPLGVIMTYGELLGDSHITQDELERARWSERIVGLGQRMNNIIDSLLFLAEVRITELEVTVLDILASAEDAIDQLAPLLQEQHAEVVITGRTSWPRALAHGPWIAQVWMNYLSNALKYGGDPPCIEVGGELQSDGNACYWVQDNGRGVRAEDQPRLFVEFSRLGQVGIPGHGLGLSIVRRIIDRLGGRVGVESEPGQGSRFWFSLPAAGEAESQEILLIP